MPRRRRVWFIRIGRCAADPLRRPSRASVAGAKEKPLSTVDDTAGATSSTAPERAGLVLGSLILVAAVENLNLSVANVALSNIGKSFDSKSSFLSGDQWAYTAALVAVLIGRRSSSSASGRRRPRRSSGRPTTPRTRSADRRRRPRRRKQRW